jgi:N-glycosylase/DNA lyase
MRGGIDSNTAVKLLGKVYDERPEFFDPSYVAQMVRPEDLTPVLEKAGLNYSKRRVPDFWVENARRMTELYDADPGNIFRGVSTYDEACLRVRNDHKGGGFKGFQKKMVSMLVYFFMDAGFVDPFDFPIPVDIQVARLTLSNKIVTVPGASPDENVLRLVGGNETVLDKVRSFYLRYSQAEGVNPLDLCNAVWMYARLRCAENPETEWERLNGGENRSRRARKVRVNWDDPSVYDRWRRTCGVCVVSGTCKINVAAMPYYNWGEILLNDPRTGPPKDVQNRLGLLLPPSQDAAVTRPGLGTHSSLKEEKPDALHPGQTSLFPD